MPTSIYRVWRKHGGEDCRKTGIFMSPHISWLKGDQGQVCETNLITLKLHTDSVDEQCLEPLVYFVILAISQSCDNPGCTSDIKPNSGIIVYPRQKWLDQGCSDAGLHRSAVTGNWTKQPALVGLIKVIPTATKMLKSVFCLLKLLKTFTKEFFSKMNWTFSQH